MQKHCMLDFETLGQKPSTVVLSLGAVLFDRERILQKTEWIFNVHEQISKGRTIDFGTIQWWMGQSEAARSIFHASSSITLQDFGVSFKEFLGDAGNVLMWSNGADFDVPILSDIWTRHISRELPWKFFNTRCFRTFNAEYDIKKLVTRRGTQHNALDDAVYQAECVLAHWNRQSS